ncbi:MAG: HU family DNA-binding protein [Synechococcaceae cyanobacterium SM2_3_1]|nr:HU family DNA-binding protein [Synechococcaceae cyanobacterium SM2_3_1]
MGDYLNRQLLAQRLADQVDGLSLRVASAAVQVLVETMAETLVSGGEIRLTGLGSFTVRYRRPRMTRHPRTHEQIMVPAAWVPRFSPSPQLRQQIQEAGLQRSHPTHEPLPTDPQILE